MSKTVRKEAFYPLPPEKVWVALTDPRALAEWLMPNNFAPVVGHKFRFQVDPMPGCGHVTECEVLEVDPPRKLVWSWMPVAKHAHPPGTRPSTVTWTLTPENSGTRLVLVHEGMEVYPWWQRLMMRFGWGTMVKRWIPKVAANVDGSGQFTPGAIPLSKRCYKTKTLPSDLTW
ncbi:MAG: SRPBCC family protein [Tepidisphaeraceae bacterium]